MVYAAPYMQQNFAQSPDFERPMTLLTEDTKRSGTLLYRYDDTGETALVPNIPCNQTIRTRIATLDYGIEVADRGLETQLKQPWLKPYERDWIKHDHRVQRERVLKIRARLAAQPNHDIPIIL